MSKILGYVKLGYSVSPNYLVPMWVKKIRFRSAIDSCGRRVSFADLHLLHPKRREEKIVTDFGLSKYKTDKRKFKIYTNSEFQELEFFSESGDFENIVGVCKIGERHKTEKNYYALYFTPLKQIYSIGSLSKLIDVLSTTKVIRFETKNWVAAGQDRSFHIYQKICYDQRLEPNLMNDINNFFDIWWFSEKDIMTKQPNFSFKSGFFRRVGRYRESGVWHGEPAHIEDNGLNDIISYLSRSL